MLYEGLLWPELISLLPPLDDERETLATLEDALAFIDACEQQKEDESVCVSQAMPSKTKRSRRNGVTTKKTAYRERVKAELQQLRHEAAALELWLTRIKLSHIYSDAAVTRIDHSIIPHSLNSQWIEVLVREFQRRRQSEAKNLKLKALVKRLVKAARSPDQALANRLSNEVLRRTLVLG